MGEKIINGKIVGEADVPSVERVSFAHHESEGMSEPYWEVIAHMAALAISSEKVGQ